MNAARFISARCPKCAAYNLLESRPSSGSITCDACRHQFTPSETDWVNSRAFGNHPLGIPDAPAKKGAVIALAAGAATLLLAIASAGMRLGATWWILIVGIPVISLLYDRWEAEHKLRRRNPSAGGIAKVFDFLDRSLPAAAQPKHREYSPPWDAIQALHRDKHSPIALLDVATDMSRHLRIRQLVNITVMDNPPALGGGSMSPFSDSTVRRAAGIYTRGTSGIILSREETYDMSQLLAVLAHECTHHKLYIENAAWPMPAEEEVFTDIAAVYFGFGSILRRGYRPRKWVEPLFLSSVEHTIAVGYITPGSISKGIDMILKRTQAEDSIKKESSLAGVASSLK